MRRADLLAAVWPDVLARQSREVRAAARSPWLSAARAGVAPGRVAPRGPGGGPAPDEARRVQLRAEVAASREAQGLPPFITDEATLDKIAELLAMVLGRDTAPRQQAPEVGASLARADAPARGAVAAAGGRLRRRWVRVSRGRPGMLAVRVVVAAVLVPVAAFYVAGVSGLARVGGRGRYVADVDGAVGSGATWAALITRGLPSAAVSDRGLGNSRSSHDWFGLVKPELGHVSAQVSWRR